jgi:hypothetical protein
LMISSSEVKFGEPLSSMQLIQQLLHYRHWVLVLHCLSIQMPIVYTKPSRAILFLNQ